MTTKWQIIKDTREELPYTATIYHPNGTQQTAGFDTLHFAKRWAKRNAKKPAPQPTQPTIVAQGQHTP